MDITIVKYFSATKIKTLVYIYLFIIKIMILSLPEHNHDNKINYTKCSQEVQ